ncbi:drug resistance transporter, EmrB/QacA subfamily [Aureimonas altamirensis DSM 21988]|uniref:MFS transporter, DHA2 family n=2 Tax=Aureimonas altamirensis TaxID=370622 RepID=A0A0P0YWN0_9HYPH|nr:MFS transporter [Aureimonas altamirensis]BAT25923.1 MFS transporter, DHA2 family [Aureimonas altamirensis]SHI75821.1 drug resistance transporter, EmrB/QacA subfamily [Aureimonas altamirensis DSM 21988]
MAGTSAFTAVEWRILAATILGSSLTFIDGTVVNVALPAIGASLDAGFSALQWVVSGYLLTLASLMLPAGTLGDRLGYARSFRLGLVLFSLASLLCAFAFAAGWLIAARLFQGMAAAVLVPASLALLAQNFRGEARGRAIGIWAASSAITTAIAPVLGGFLVDVAGWRVVFLINLPLAAAAWVLARPASGNDAAKDAGPVDLAGAALATASLGLMSLGLVRMGEGALAQGGMLLALSMPFLAGFVAWQFRCPNPMMPPDLFASRVFSGVNLQTVLLYAAFSGGLLMVPLSLIEGHGFDALEAGAALLPISIIMGLFSSMSGRYAAKAGPALSLTLGPLLAAAGFTLIGVSAPQAGYWLGYLPGLIVLGCGMTMAVPPLTTAVLDAVPDGRSGTASSINNVAARTGGLLAVAALGFAFGGAATDSLGDAGIGRATASAMFGAAILSALSAIAGYLATRGGVSPKERVSTPVPPRR